MKTRLFRRFPPLLAALLGLLAWLQPPLGAAQQSVEYQRLANDQDKLADQVRRLERLLEHLEQREREAGNAAQAELLAGARQRLHAADSVGDLSTAIERIAADLVELRSGAALEAQSQVIHELESLLSYLLQQEMMDRIQRLQEDLARQAEHLSALADRQARLLEENQALQDREDAGGAADSEARGRLAEEQAKLSADLEAWQKSADGQLDDPARTEEAARAAAEAAQELEKAAAAAERADPGADRQEQRDGAPQAPAESRPEQPPPAGTPPPDVPPGEQRTPSQNQNRPGQDQPPPSPNANQPSPSENDGENRAQQQQQSQRPPPGQQRPQSRPNSQQGRESLEQAEQKQQEALDRLQDAADQAQEELNRLQDAQRQEAILSLLLEAEALLERHRLVHQELADFASKQGDEPVARRERVRLRQWAEEQQQISEGADRLMNEVSAGGADSVPFLLRTLQIDHQRLAQRLGPPRYGAGAVESLLSEQLLHNWEELVDALKTELERIRRRIEQQQQGGDALPPEQGGSPPLVGFAEEVQLLKRLEQNLRDRLESFRKRREILAGAGLELDGDDLMELDGLVQRQSELRQLYEAILKRLEADAQPQQVPPEQPEPPSEETVEVF